VAAGATTPIKVLYIGNDDAYWESVRYRFQTAYEHLKFEYLKLFEKEEYQQIFIEALEIKPDIIYIDFSSASKQMERLSLLFRRELTFRETPIVGLVEDKKEVQAHSIAKLNFMHIKCGEMHDIIYDPFYCAFPQMVKKPQFALARYGGKEMELWAEFRIGFITPTSVHVESDIALNKGDEIKLESNIPRNLLPSSRFVVQERHSANLYYDFEYAYTLTPAYVDKPDISRWEGSDKDEKTIKEEFKMAVHEYQNELTISKKKFQKWVTDNIASSVGKKTKILIVDNKMKVLEDLNKPLDSFKSSIRVMTSFDETLSVMGRYVPQFIGFQYESSASDDDESVEEKIAGDKKEEGEVKKFDCISQIGSCIEKAKKIEGPKPFIVVFNDMEHTSKSFQESFNYPNILVNPTSINLETIVQMATVFQTKQEKKMNDAIQAKMQQLRKQDPMKYRNLRSSDFMEKNYYISKSSDLSQARAKIDVAMMSLTESQMSFSVDRELKHSIYQIKKPIRANVTLVNVDGQPHVKDKSSFIYLALLNGSGEEDKQEIRQRVNEVFFSGVNEKRDQEQKDFDVLNKKMLDERLAEEEEEARIAAEAEKDKE
jgi:hypothetical protein